MYELDYTSLFLMFGFLGKSYARFTRTRSENMDNYRG